MKRYWLRYNLIIVVLLICTTLTAQSKDSLQIISLVKESVKLLEDQEYEKSRDVAEQILKVDSTYSTAYMLLGVIYTSYVNEGAINERLNYLEKGMIYCLIFNTFKKAKEVDVSRTAEVNRYLGEYRNHLPTYDAVFLPKDWHGKEVTVGGWINRKTIFLMQEKTEI